MADDKDDELVLHAPEGKVRPRRKRQTVDDRLQSKTMSNRLLGHFMVGYERKWGFPYPVSVAEPRDLSILKKLGAEWGEPAVAATIDLFFTTTDPKVTGREFNGLYNVPNFLYWAPRLRMSAAGGDLTEKTASNVHEITKAMGPRKTTRGDTE